MASISLKREHLNLRKPPSISLGPLSLVKVCQHSNSYSHIFGGLPFTGEDLPSCGRPSVAVVKEKSRAMLTPPLNWCEMLRLFMNWDERTVTEFLENPKYIDMSLRDSEGMTPWHYAAAWGHHKVTKILIDIPQYVSCLDTPERRQGDTALILAARYQQYETLQMLLDAGADVNRQNGKRESVLFWAVKHNKLALTRELLRRGANPNQMVRHGFTPLIMAIIERRLDLVKALIEGGSDIQLPDDRGHRPLSWAVTSDDISIAAVLLSTEAITPAISTSLTEHSPLIWAVIVGNYDMVRLLLSCGADMAQQSSDLRTPLIWAVMYRNVSVAKLLLQSGAHPDEVDGSGKSALTWAVLENHQEMVHLLVRHGASHASWIGYKWYSPSSF